MGLEFNFQRGELNFVLGSLSRATLLGEEQFVGD